MTVFKSTTGKFITKRKHGKKVNFESSFQTREKNLADEKNHSDKATSKQSFSWREGLRIVELGLLSDQLEKGSISETKSN